MGGAALRPPRHEAPSTGGYFATPPPYPPAAASTARPLSVIRTLRTSTDPDALTRERHEATVHEPGDDGHWKSVRQQERLRGAVAPGACEHGKCMARLTSPANNRTRSVLPNDLPKSPSPNGARIGQDRPPVSRRRLSLGPH